MVNLIKKKHKHFNNNVIWHNKCIAVNININYNLNIANETDGIIVKFMLNKNINTKIKDFLINIT